MRKLLLAVALLIAGIGVATAQPSGQGIGPGSIPCAYTSCTISTLVVSGASTLNGATSIVGTSLGLSGNQSASGIFGTNGIRYKNVAGTLTDTTSSGTVAANYDSKFGGNTLTATNTTTITNDYGTYFVAPVCSTNVTCTNNYALGADSLDIIGPSVFGGAITQSSGNASLGSSTLFVNSGTGAVETFNNGFFAFSSGGTAGGTPDTFIGRQGAASIRLGAADVDTAPVAQTLRTQGALAGGTSNVAGANWTFIASPGKGTGAGGSFIFQTAPAGSTGTVVNAPVTALTIDSTQLSTFSGNVSVLNTTGSPNLTVQTNTASQNSTVFLKGANRNWYISATDTGADAPFRIGTGNTPGSAIAVSIAPSTGIVAFPSTTTGANADFACIGTGGILQLQATACTISSIRFKEDIKAYSASALASIMDLRTFTYRLKKTQPANKDPNTTMMQLGLTAENIAKVMPLCAIYENDMETPKSYRQECIIALLVKGEQELKIANANLQYRIFKLEQAR